MIFDKFKIFKRILYVLIFCLMIVSVGWSTNYYAYPTTCSGSETGSGTWDDPWVSMATVNANSYSAGDDLYFNKNTNFTLTSDTCYLEVDWSGVNDSNRVIIGCYDGNDSDVNDCDAVPFVNGNRPIFSGDGSYPAIYKGIINVQNESVDYVTIRDLKLIYVPEQSNGVTVKYSNYVDVYNCYFWRNQQVSIQYAESKGDATTNEVVSYNLLSDTGYPNFYSIAGDINFIGHGVQGETQYATIEYNVLLGYGRGREGIGLYQTVRYMTVQYNTVMGYANVNYYIAGAKDSVIRYNLSYGTTEGTRTYAGIWSEVEAWEPLAEIQWHGGNEYYGNLVAGTKYGMKFTCTVNECEGLGGPPDSRCKGDFRTENCSPDEKVYGNTFVDNEYNIAISNEKSSDDIDIQNNISWSGTSGMHHVNNPDPVGVSWAYNLFYKYGSGGDPPAIGTDARDGTGTIITDPELAKETGWRSLSRSDLDGEEFKIGSTSDAIGAGTSLTGFDNRLTASDFKDPSPTNIIIADDSSDPDIGAWMYEDADPSIHYAKPTTCGAGSGDGSYTTPWTGMSTINAHTFADGDELYFEKDTSLTLTADACRLIVDWGGVDNNNRAIIGCYDDADSNVDDCDPTIWDSSNRPTFSGNSTYPQTYQGIIQVGDYDYVTVQDLRIINSNGHSIYVANGDYPIVDNNYIYRSAKHAILFGAGGGDGVANGTISDNYVEGTGYGGSSFQGSIVLTGGDTDDVTKDNLVTGNKVLDGRSEGINVVKKAVDNIIEKNIVYDIMNVQIYIDASKRNTVRYNLVYQSSAYDQGSSPYGIAVTNEIPRDYVFSSDNKIYGNFVAGFDFAGLFLSCDIQRCTGVGTPIGDCAGDFSSAYCHDGTLVYNNTLIDNEYNFRFEENSSSDSMSIINNISFHTASTGQFHTNLDNPAGTTSNTNLFNQTDDAAPANTNSGYIGYGRVIGDPDFVRQSSFYNQAPGTFDQDDFKQDTQADAYNAGTDLGGSPYYVDYWGTNKDTNYPWDIGAHEWNDGGEPPAGNLSIFEGGLSGGSFN